MKVNLSKKEVEWIFEEMKILTDSYRTDRKEGITFDKSSFDKEDYSRLQIAMLSKLYLKLGGKNEKIK